MLSTQISFNISTADDAVRASRIMAAIQAEYTGPEADVIDPVLPPAEPSDKPARRTRRTAAQVDPVEAYNAKVAAADHAAELRSVTQRQADAIAAQSDPAPVEAAQPVEQADPAPVEAAQPVEQFDPAPVDRDAQLRAVRDMAKARGAAWLRPQLTRYGVEMLSGLSDAQLAEILAS